MDAYKKTVLALFALTIIGLGVPLAAAQSSGILYQYSAGMVSLETDNIAVKVTGNNQVPHFHWWDPNNPTTDYHVMFVKMFEANDTNADGEFDNDTDVIIGAPFPLPTSNWNFSGFETEEEDGNAIAIHFNFTTSEMYDPRPLDTGTDYGNLPSQPAFEVGIGIYVHLNLSNPGEMKFDLVVDGWEWTYEDSILVLQFTVTESAHGQVQGDQNPGEFHKTGTKFQFENGYFEYEETALAANNIVQVRASYGEGTSLQDSGEAIYLSFEYFGDDTLEYDPILGVESSTSVDIVLDPMTMGIVGGVAVIAILAIVFIRKK